MVGNRVFIAILIASMIHMAEEYVYPGGLPDFSKRLNPRFAPLVTPLMAVIVNGLQLLLCLAAIIVGSKLLAFSLSVASLLFINGWIHIFGCIKVRGYVPGAISGALLYLPLSVYAYYHFGSSGQLTLAGGAISGLLGVVYQTVPISYLALASAIKRA
jgi:hypothetical protein